MLKLSKCKTKLKRRIPFNPQKLDFNLMNDCTIHVESFPKEMHAENMVKVFSRAGVIRHIKLPRLPDGQLKGFCFIEFAAPDQAEKARLIFNNCVPEEFTNN